MKLQINTEEPFHEALKEINKKIPKKTFREKKSYYNIAALEKLVRKEIENK